MQSRHEGDAHFQEEKLRLNLQPNDSGLCECRGCVQGDYPLYLPDDELFTQKLVEHLKTLHGGSWVYHDESETTILDSATKKIDQACGATMLWLEKLPSIGVR